MINPEMKLVKGNKNSLEGKVIVYAKCPMLKKLFSENEYGISEYEMEKAGDAEKTGV